MTVDPLIERDGVVLALQHSLTDGTHGLSHVPGLVKRVVAEECWRERVVRVSGQVAQFSTFEQFVREGPPEGLGGDLRTLKRLCSDDTEALDAIDRATIGRQGGDHTSEASKNDIVQVAPNGNAAQAAIRRLRKDRPDLHARVLTGEMTPHKAMREAGFRPPTATIRLDDVAATARTLQRNADPEFVRQLVALLLEDAQ